MLSDAHLDDSGASGVVLQDVLGQVIITYNAHEPPYGYSVGKYLRVSTLIHIRPFELDDARVILELEEEIFNEPNPVLYSMIENYPTEGFLVAECEGVVCGYLVGVLIMDEARVLLLAVKESHRRQKIGKMLMEEFLESVRGRANMIRLEVRVSNLGAQTFYFKLGFKFIGLISRYYRNGDSAYIMVKPLDQLTLFL